MVETEPVRKKDQHGVSQEYVDRLRNIGASKFAVDFAQRLVVRFNEQDLDQAWRNGFIVGVLVALGIFAVLLFLPAPR